MARNMALDLFKFNENREEQSVSKCVLCNEEMVSAIYYINGVNFMPHNQIYGNMIFYLRRTDEWQTLIWPAARAIR